MTQNALPPLFLERLKNILPENAFTTALTSFQQKKKVTFRLNTLLDEEKNILTLLKKENIPFTSLNFPQAFYIEPECKESLTKSSIFQKHLIYIQNPSSMLPPLILNPQPDENILDLTAAPGSKTLQMVAMMENQGRIAAVEKIRNRFFRLKKNLNDHGALTVQTYLKDGSNVWKPCEEQFDRVLLDSPCSSESRFSSLNPESYEKWSLRKIKEMRRKQEKLLYSAVRCLKPGGNLVYSTCAFSPEENEAIIDKMLSEFSNIQLAPIDLPMENQQQGLSSWQGDSFKHNLSHCVRILPNEFFDGFFIAKLKKIGR